MYDFSIGVLLDSFRTDTEQAMKQAAALGLNGIQVYATEGNMAPENMDSRRRKEFCRHGRGIRAQNFRLVRGSGIRIF